MERLEISRALRLIREAVESARELFVIDGISTSVEVEYLNSDFNPCSEASAKYLTVSLVIRADGLYTEELAISVGATVKRGSVDGTALSSTVDEFKKAASDAASKLAGSFDRQSTLTELSRQAEEDYELLIKKVHKAERRTMIYYALGAAAIIGALVITTVLA